MNSASFVYAILTLLCLFVIGFSPSVASRLEEEALRPNGAARRLDFDKEFSNFVKRIGGSVEDAVSYKNRLIEDLKELEAEDKDYYDCLEACEIGDSNREEFEETVCAEGYCNRYVSTLKSGLVRSTEIFEGH